jgi:WD40 repeat protein
LLATPPAGPKFIIDPSGRWAVNQLSFSAGNAHLWDLAGLVGANPRLLRRNGEWILSDIDFHPDLNWVIATTKNRREVSFWPLSVPNPFVVDATDGWKVFEFTPDGRHILTSDYGSGQRSGARQVRLWPLPGDESAIVDLKFPPHAQSGFRTVTIDPSGERVLSTGYGHHIFLLSVTGKEPRQLEGFPATELVHGGAFSPSGRQIAAASMTADDQATLRVWDLETGEVRVFDQPKDPEAYAGYFARFFNDTATTEIYTSGANGLLRWDLETGSYEQILRSPPGGGKGMRMTSDRQKMFTWEEGGPEPRRVETDIYDLRTGAVRSLASTRGTWTFALSRDGTIRASGMREGRIRVGRTDESEPHLLLGHEGAVDGIAISPDLRWIASSGQDKTLRLWPMPDLSKPPLHTLPHDELIARLKTLTNLRVVRDEKSATGWKLEVGPFPGWAEVPEW